MKKHILVVNDDGIHSPGILELAKMAQRFGKVTVVAPKHQCSAMSHRITINQPITYYKEELPLEGVEAYAVDGTPADCTKLAVLHLLEEKPDYVFSGINYGWNVGIDILYSGTIGAAMEGLYRKIPSFAFSQDKDAPFDVFRHYGANVVSELMEKEIQKNQIWNINFPNCDIDEVKGIDWETGLSHEEIIGVEYYSQSCIKENEYLLTPENYFHRQGEPDSDIDKVQNGYITISKIDNNVL